MAHKLVPRPAGSHHVQKRKRLRLKRSSEKGKAAMVEPAGRKPHRGVGKAHSGPICGGHSILRGRPFRGSLRWICRDRRGELFGMSYIGRYITKQREREAQVEIDEVWTAVPSAALKPRTKIGIWSEQLSLLGNFQRGGSCHLLHVKTPKPRAYIDFKGRELDLSFYVQPA